eukprot:scaffold2041_cov110-Isochrysis_galbana.AAC.2
MEADEPARSQRTAGRCSARAVGQRARAEAGPESAAAPHAAMPRRVVVRRPGIRGAREAPGRVIMTVNTQCIKIGGALCMSNKLTK